MTIDAEHAYGVWKRLISDEKLYEATLEGRHADLAKSRGLDARDLAVLDELSRFPGTRWNIDNLHFRTALDVALEVSRYLPRSVFMLVGKSQEWLLDVFYEYMSHSEWMTCGQCRLAESERFAEYARKRIMKRRPVPRHFEAVLDFELAVVRLIKNTQALEREAWPAGRGDLDSEALLPKKPRPSPAAALIHVPVDITEWIRTREPRGEVDLEPMTVLAHIPARNEHVRFVRLSEGTEAVYAACTGALTTEQIAAALSEAHDFDEEEVVALIQKRVASGALLV